MFSYSYIIMIILVCVSNYEIIIKIKYLYIYHHVQHLIQEMVDFVEYDILMFKINIKFREIKKNKNIN